MKATRAVRRRLPLGRRHLEAGEREAARPCSRQATRRQGSRPSAGVRRNRDLRALAAGKVRPIIGKVGQDGAPGYAPNFRKLVVNSPGGSIHPAYLIGKALQAGSYEVQVAENGACVSACTLLLAAAAERSAYSSSSIAVHWASNFEEDGDRKPETVNDLTVTAILPAT